MANQLRDQFHEITTKKYQDQAIWFLNGFWNDGAEQEAENIWKFTQKFIEIDFQKKKEGNELDEFLSHKFLESLGETLTVVALRDRLKKIDLDFNGKMALIEYLTVKYKKDVKEVVNAPQGSNPEEVKKAQDKLNEVQKELDKQRQVEESVKKAEDENRAAVAELKKQEDEYQRQISTLEAKSKDTNSGAVQRNKAAAELAQLKSEDSLPLRKAKISQEASLRKVEKERKAAEEQTKRVEASYKEAQDYFEQVKRMGGSPLGAIWWMERELKEAQKYLPKSKQKL